MKKALLTLILLAAIGGSGYAYYNYRHKKPAPTVATAAVTVGDIADRVGATGTLQAVTTVQVGTQVSGTIQQLNADFNSLVKKGQVLARLDPSLFQTQIEQARANLLRAEADVERLRVELQDAKTKFARAKELAGRQLLPKSDLDTAEVTVGSAEAQLRSAQAQVAQAQASLNQNQVNLEHTVIEAPIDGLVISRNVDVGQTVAASMQAPTLYILAADLTKMQVLANLDESDVGRIRPGQRVVFRVDAYPADEFVGTVAQVRLQPIIQQNVVTYATVIDVPNPDLKLKPGMTANVNVEIARRSDVLRVPNTALRFRPSNDMYAAFGQTPPPAGGPGEGASGAGRGRGRSNASVGENGAAAAPGAQSKGSPAGRARSAAAGSGRPDGDLSARLRDSESIAPDARRGRAPGEGATAAPPKGSGREPTPEQLQNLSPEQRTQLIETLKGRGGNSSTAAPGTSATRAAAARDGGSARNDKDAGRAAGAGQSLSARNPHATTIDALFGPLQSVETVGRVWIFVDNQLKPIRARLGITDGQVTELVQAEGVEEGTQLVTNVSTGNEATRPAATGFPFMGQPPGRFGGPGGFPGGGGNRGGGGGR
jgi:HlyD family secretion protein